MSCILCQVGATHTSEDCRRQAGIDALGAPLPFEAPCWDSEHPCTLCVCRHWHTIDEHLDDLARVARLRVLAGVTRRAVPIFVKVIPC